MLCASGPAGTPGRQGGLLAMRGDTAGAIDAFEQCRRLRPDDPDPALQLLDAYQRTGDLRQADALAATAPMRQSDNDAVRCGPGCSSISLMSGLYSPEPRPPPIFLQPNARPSS